MDMFNLDITKVANTLMNQSALFNCSLEEAWNKWMHPIFTENITFEEVKKHIDEKVALGNKFNNL